MGYCEIMINNFTQGHNFGVVNSSITLRTYCTKLYLIRSQNTILNKYCIFKDQTQVDLFFW